MNRRALAATQAPTAGFHGGTPRRQGGALTALVIGFGLIGRIQSGFFRSLLVGIDTAWANVSCVPAEAAQASRASIDWK